MELLPCPFCGGEATFDHDDNGWNWISCGKCWTATSSRTHTMEDCHPLLAEQWNRRVIPLHEMLDDCREQFEEQVAKQSAALKLASLALSEGVEYVEEPPEKNCSCHLSPPCNDCVDHSAVREFFIDARKALAAIDALGA